MIKISRKGLDVKIKLYNEFNQVQSVSATFTKSIATAQELTKTLRKAVKLGYGFAKCRAILDGDKL